MSVQRSVSLTTRGRVSTSPNKRNSAMLFTSNVATAVNMYDSTKGETNAPFISAEVQHLRTQVEALRKEWQTSENLLTESQRDNEQKHFMVEGYKQYVKELEKLLESTLGATWRIDNKITGPSCRPPAPIISTPSSKPLGTSLRHSTSVSFSSKRSSRMLSRRISGAGDWSTLAGVQEMPSDEATEMDNTPTGALKRLEGQNHLGGSMRGRKMVVPVVEIEEPPITPVAQLTKSYKPPPVLTETRSQIDMMADRAPSTHLSRDTQVNKLIFMLANIPLDHILPALDASKRIAVAKQAERSLDAQQEALVGVLRDAERRAADRESRLKSLLSEAKQMAGAVPLCSS